MKITIHKQKNCFLCNKLTMILKNWNILAYKSVYDNPTKDRNYPYVVIEFEYGEFVEMLGKGGLL